MVARGHNQGTRGLENNRRRRYETDRRWHTGAALAHGRESGRSCSMETRASPGSMPEGKSFVTEHHGRRSLVFSQRVPHSIQGLNPDVCEFLLVFDRGNFSEYETVLLTD